ELKARAGEVAARVLEVAQADVRWEDGRFCVAGAPERSVDLAEVAAAVADGPDGRDGTLEASGRATLPGPVFPFGAFAAMVEVDRETGSVDVLRLVAVDDAGTIVNPML